MLVFDISLTGSMGILVNSPDAQRHTEGRALPELHLKLMIRGFL